VPDSARLTRANLPEALRDTFVAYPLVPGSSWTWRITDTNAGVSWTTQLMTETVEAAWLEGDAVVVRSRVETRPLMAAARGEISLASEPAPTDPPMDEPHSVLRFVMPNLILADRDPGPGVPLTELVRPGARARLGRSRAVLSAFVGLIPSDHLGVDNDVADEPADIVTPAGSFQGCWLTWNLGGASHGSARWFCPGVGYVQYAYGDAAGMHASNALADLLRWRRGSLPER
jgi:hypothetical protein